MRRTFIAVLSVGVGLATAAPTIGQFQTRISVGSATPSQVTVIRGEPAIRVALSGAGLDRLSTARVLLFGRESSTVHAKLLPTRSSTSRVLEIVADPIGRDGRGLEVVLGSTLLPDLAVTVPAQINVQMPPKPDLVIAAIQLSAVSSTQTRATIRVVNVGDGPAETATRAGIGLSCEVVATSTTVPMTSTTSTIYVMPSPPPPPPLEVALVEPVRPTESRYESWTFNATYNLSSSTSTSLSTSSSSSKSLVCEVDKAGAVAESNETNNRREQPISG